MESCLLCLEINKDVLDCIRVNSIQWQEQDIAKTIEKHFPSLNTIHPSSAICLSCWREVDGFHKFFLRIEEAHANFGKIKLENCVTFAECKEELIMQKLNIKHDDTESDKDNIAFCFLEPEILIHQNQQKVLTEPEILVDQTPTLDLIVDKESVTTEPIDELDIDDIPLNQICKRMKFQSKLVIKDPLEKSKKTKKRNSKPKVTKDGKTKPDNNIENSKLKNEPIELSDNISDCISGNENDASDVICQRGKDSSGTTDNSKDESNKCSSKQRTSRQENDDFIAEHFKQMFCDLCQLPFKTFTALQKHFSKDHKQRCYVVCCKRKFSDRTRLVDHLLCHLNPDHFKCNQCGKSMSDRLTFDNHMLRVHRANEVVRKHCCDVCGKSFAKSYVLRIHKLTHLPEEEKKFPCSDCGKNYASTYQLNLHKQAVHLKRFAKICYICGKAINSSAEFKVHMNKHEGISLHVFSCDICGLRLTSARGLKLHKESQHPVGGKQEHYCPICPKISPSLIALKKHINTMHEKGYDHKCSMCEKAFRRSETLKEHMASHTGTPLYKCPWCPKTFNSNGNMHSHRKNKHPKEYLELKLQKYN